MLTRMRIRNFKAFGPEADWFPLGELTLILGPNSSGKSSILQALLLLAQSWSTPSAFLELVPDGAYVSLGHLANVQHYGRPVPIALAFELQGGSVVELFFDNPGTTAAGPLRKVVTSRRAPHSQRRDELHWLRRSGTADFDLAVRQLEPDTELRATDEAVAVDAQATAAWLLALAAEAPDASDSVELTHLAKVIRGDFAPLPPEPDDFSADFEDVAPAIVEPMRFMATLTSADDVRLQLDCARSDEETEAAACVDYFNSPFPPPEDLARYAVVKDLLFDHWRDCVWALRNYLLQMAYLGPLREPGRRVYPARAAAAGLPRVGRAGADLAHVLAHHGAELGRGSVQTVLEQCNQVVQRIGVPYRIRLESLPSEDLAVSHRIRLEPLEDDTLLENDRGLLKLDLCDVGFGVSQVLPIVVQFVVWRMIGDRSLHGESQPALGAEARLLLMEQPELHLHPAWQAELTSMLLDSWPIEPPVQDTPAYRVQSIVECHSELMVLRLSRLVRARTGNESPLGRFRILTVRQVQQSDGRKTQVAAVEMDDEGFFPRSEFADEFFASRYDEEGI